MELHIELHGGAQPCAQNVIFDIIVISIVWDELVGLLSFVDFVKSLSRHGTGIWWSSFTNQYKIGS